MTHRQLAEWVRDARKRACELAADLADEDLLGPRLAILNPLLWELGHLAWFQEKWVLRQAAGARSIRPNADQLYDSAAVPHDTRWDLPLPNRQATLQYLHDVRDRVLEKIEREDLDRSQIYFVLLTVFHEDMHTEAFTYTRQTLGHPAPRLSGCGESASGKTSGPSGGPFTGDVEVL